MEYDGGYGGTDEGDGGSAFDVEPASYYDDSDYGDDGGYVEMSPDDLDARIQQAVQQQFAPIEQAAHDAQQAAEAERLVELYPQLAEQDEAMALVRDARQAAEFLGHPELANSPRFWGLVQQMRMEGGAAAAGGQQADPRVEAILTGGHPGALGARVLEWGGGGHGQPGGDQPFWGS